jgi:ATP-dependent exoDNAse (exonuclease V) alpha subunit
MRRTFKLGGKTGITVERKQFPLTPAYAFTDFKSLGQTIESVLVDLAKPPSGGLTSFNAYVALSRSRGRDTIRLLRDFDEKLFTTHPNEQL